jgi:hypothetical protein
MRAQQRRWYVWEDEREDEALLKMDGAKKQKMPSNYA